MTTQKDYYKILGVDRSDSKETIKKAYKKLAMKYHPDRVSEDKKKEYESKFKEINEAYTVLGDEKKKQQYDTYGHDNFNQGGHQGNPFQGEDISDIFRSMFEGGFGGSRSGSYGRSRVGKDLQYEVMIDFEEAAFGCEKEIRIRKNILCEKCNGTGAKDEELKECPKCEGHGRIEINQRTPFGIIRQETICDKCDGLGTIPKNKCDRCNGDGVYNKTVSIKVQIPQGIDNKQILRVIGEGNSIKNGKNGDLLLIVLVRPHKVFKREYDDIYMELPISFSQAALGCKISVPTLSGDMKIKIASGTESGDVLRLKNKGIKNVNNYNIGDQFITIKIKTPKKLNRKQKELFDKLSKFE